MAKVFNPDDLIGDLETICRMFKVTIECRRFTGDVVVYDVDGMAVCSFNKLHGIYGPNNLEIGTNYLTRYSTKKEGQS